MRPTSPLIATLAFSVAASACISREVAQVDPRGDVEQRHVIPATQRRDIDILFVIDDSGSMLGEQTSLADNFDRFIAVLEGIEGGLPNVHIGVVSTNVGAGSFGIDGCFGDGDGGRLRDGSDNPACDGPTDRFIRDVAIDDTTRERNYTGSLEETFGCMAQLGTSGCGLEQHWEAMKRALEPTNAYNAGFLREDALLAVIFLSDEDDCSAFDPSVFDPRDPDLGDLSLRCARYGVLCEGEEIAHAEGVYENCMPYHDSPYLQPPDHYVEFLQSLKPSRFDVIVAGIVGDSDEFSVQTGDFGLEPAPSCVSESGSEGRPGLRFQYFLEQFPDRNTQVSICQDDLSNALEQVASLLGLVVGPACLASNVDARDLDAAAPGIQLDCSVSDVRYLGTDEASESLIPACAMVDAATPAAGARPCWWVREAPIECDGDRLLFQVEREVDAPVGTDVVIKYRGE